MSFAIVVAVVVAGCGGNAKASNLRRYLDEEHTQNQRYESVRASALNSLDAIGTTEESWDEAARRMKRSRDRYNELAIANESIVPPGELTSVHRDLGRSYQLFGQYLDDVQAALKTHNLSLTQRAVNGSLGQRAVELRSNWRTAVTAYARKLNVDVPGWVRRVGTLP